MIPFHYELRRSARKTLAIEIKKDGAVLVRAPKNCPQYQIEAFIHAKEDWIRARLTRIQEQKEQAASLLLPAAEAARCRRDAGERFARQAAHYAEIMGVAYRRITVRDQKTRWGSCSASGNLNFNWRLVLAPAEVLDYVVVHELAHRREMNHSPAFWGIVEETLPEYRIWRKWLKENGTTLLQIEIS